MIQDQEFKKTIEGLFGSLPKQEPVAPILTKEESELVHSILFAQLKDLSDKPADVTTDGITQLLQLKELLK